MRRVIEHGIGRGHRELHPASPVALAVTRRTAA